MDSGSSVGLAVRVCVCGVHGRLRDTEIFVGLVVCNAWGIQVRGEA